MWAWDTGERDFMGKAWVMATNKFADQESVWFGPVDGIGVWSSHRICVSKQIYKPPAIKPGRFR